MTATASQDITRSTSTIFVEYREARLALRTATRRYFAAHPGDRLAIRLAEVDPASALVDSIYDRMTEHERLVAAPL